MSPITLNLKQTYQMMLSMAGTYQKKLRQSLFFLALSSLIQGIAFAVFIPIFFSLQQNDIILAIYWALTLTFLLVLASVLRWKGQNFDYDGDMANACLELQTILGIQLRQIPQENLAKYRSGDMDNTLSSNVDQVLTYTITISMLTLNAILIPLTTAITILFFDWRIALVLFAVLIMIIPFYYWRRPAYAKGRQALEQVNSQLNAELIEFVQGISVLRSALCINNKSNRIYQMYVKVQQYQEYGHRKGAKPNLIIASVVELALLLCLSLGLMWVLDGSLSIMFLAAMMVIIVRFSEPLSNVVSMFGIYEMMNAGFQRVKQFQQIKPLVVLQPALQPKRFDIEFDQVSFAYQDQTGNALQQTDLTIPQYSFTALVGASGCGKSTLTKLITRYADPQHGMIRIGGINVRQINNSHLMQMISIVFQDVYLFQDTILNNIRMGNQWATEQDVVDAAKQAQCHDFIMALPNGYQTQVSELGGIFSGGEKQRISIARALLKNTPIVILDEPTAALDVFSEVAVQKAIDTLVKNKTVIVIAHRLTTIARADKIVVMDQGKIIEQGNHDDLLRKNGRYADLWHFQHTE